MTKFATYTFVTMMTVTYIGQVLTGANASVLNLAFAGLAILLHRALTNTNDSE